MKVICISGSVGTGKTTLAKELSKRLDYEHVDLNKLIKKHKVHEGFDKKRKCYVVDIKNVNEFLISEINRYKKAGTKGLIIDSHLSHYLPRKHVDLCLVTKCDLKELKKRLKKRWYSKSKIMENLECEIFDTSYNEAKEHGHRVLVIDTTKDLNIDEILESIKT